jgi:hypothetical protein
MSWEELGTLQPEKFRQLTAMLKIIPHNNEIQCHFKTMILHVYILREEAVSYL